MKTQELMEGDHFLNDWKLMKRKAFVRCRRMLMFQRDGRSLGRGTSVKLKRTGVCALFPWVFGINSRKFNLHLRANKKDTVHQRVIAELIGTAGIGSAAFRAPYLYSCTSYALFYRIERACEDPEWNRRGCASINRLQKMAKWNFVRKQRIHEGTVGK